MKKIIHAIACVCVYMVVGLGRVSAAEQSVEKLGLSTPVPVAGNSWVKGSIEQSHALITENGVVGWQDTDHKLVTFVYFNDTGRLNLGLTARLEQGQSSVAVSIGDRVHEVSIANRQFKTLPVGTFDIKKIGYHAIVIKGLPASQNALPDITDIVIGGEATDTAPYFVKDDFYWGRRGPSVHLQYQLPDSKEDYEWFYSEVTVPDGADTMGSYYMANGFDGGYFGIQVNSETERRVLFSIWSPYTTDDPEQIPQQYRVELLNKGQGVQTGKFGNEGSGGQSYLTYPWKTGTTYKFLTRYEPDMTKGKTVFSAYFFAPEEKKWRLIARFRRPQTKTYLQGPYSFLENFITGAGQFERTATYSNQWVRTASGQWQEMRNARFTYDNTARKKSRLDYQGGVNEIGFYLKNTGFFSNPTQYNTTLHRTAGVKPDIELSELP
ncbi:DUF3472 domain-containing protein [Lacimicrobium alkaliphilum]|uniref:DUF5077 domain-containing protein n=1 Tax=Lacimicrobium alkaliphilum TaxID=1526571 RepID=A0ABQ1RGL4_9ALTE|nr:DUF3472 domain-containing protein [Lacimicrobium alkaliphilum]GGD69761.1 hypothetical protein GCM10011357_25980 [Lacimicrobium alkaliphilum]